MPISQLNVCLVDDDHIYQFTAKKTIEATNFKGNISSFSNGEDAIRFLTLNCLLTADLPDIIFLDINMPIMDGWQFLDAFNKLKKSFAKKIHVYMVSSSIDAEDMKKSKEFYGVDDYLVKPIHRDLFREILQPFASA